MKKSHEVFKKYYVLDTNIILQDAKSMFTLSDNHENLLVIPETVLDEIDSKKSGFDEINYQAREFGRLLSDAKVIGMQTIIGGFKIISIELHEPNLARIDLITKESYTSYGKEHSPNIINDRKILEICEFAKEHYASHDTELLIFLSLDILARTRAISLGIKTDTLKGNAKDEVDFTFHKQIEFDQEVSSEYFEDRAINEIDPEYKIQNFSYTFKLPTSGREVLSMIQNGKIVLLDEDEIRRQTIGPKNKEQLFFASALIDPFYHMLVVEAKAGSGKTLLALSGAMKLVKNRQYAKIVYIRNSIESLDKGEDVGYLSGNAEKFAIYNHPLMDSIEYIVRLELTRSNANKNGSAKTIIDEQVIGERVTETMERYGIQTMWPGEIRGRTISNAVVIIDEAQNMSNKTLQTVMTRLDESCKIVVLGSQRQIDNNYINKFTNGLATLLLAATYKHDEINLFSITLSKVLRGPITEFAERIFSSHVKPTKTLF